MQRTNSAEPLRPFLQYPPSLGDSVESQARLQALPGEVREQVADTTPLDPKAAKALHDMLDHALINHYDSPAQLANRIA